MRSDERLPHRPPVLPLAEGVQWQDNLLQSYRALHLGLQSVFAGLVGGLAVVGPSTDSTGTAVAAWLIATGFWIAARLTLVRTRDIVTAKSEDVSAWERAIILAEATAPEDGRHYSRFKLRQRAARMAQASGADGTNPAHAGLLRIMTMLPSTLTPQQRTSALQTWDNLVGELEGRSDEERKDLRLIARELLEPGQQVGPETVELLLEVAGNVRTELDRHIATRLALVSTSAWVMSFVFLVLRFTPW